MRRFPLSPSLEADCVEHEGSRIGQLYRAKTNKSGGRLLTPIGRYFAWRPGYIENARPHWRVDCYVRHRLALRPEQLGRQLVAALVKEGLCAEPLWLSWHRGRELGGAPFGEIYDFD